MKTDVKKILESSYALNPFLKRIFKDCQKLILQTLLTLKSKFKSEMLKTYNFRSNQYLE